MATSNSNVLSGFDAYIAADVADGRTPSGLARCTVLSWPAGPLKVRIDVVLGDGNGLAARALFWDGPDLTEAQAPLIAAPYAAALEQLHPEALSPPSASGRRGDRLTSRYQLKARSAKSRPPNAFSSASSTALVKTPERRLRVPDPLCPAPSLNPSGRPGLPLRRATFTRRGGASASRPPADRAARADRGRVDPRRLLVGFLTESFFLLRGLFQSAPCFGLFLAAFLVSCHFLPRSQID